MNTEQIAKTCHAIHIAFCKEMSIPTQPSWEEVDDSHKEVVFNSIKAILNGEITSSIDSHNKFVESKTSQGWKYGKNYDAQNKINPRLCSYGDLSLIEKVKEVLFFACISSFK